MKHIYICKLTSMGSDNGLAPGWRQAINWTNDGIFLIGCLGTNFSEILIETHTFSFKKMHFKMLSGKWWLFCFCLHVLTFHWELTLWASTDNWHWALVSEVAGCWTNNKLFSKAMMADIPWHIVVSLAYDYFHTDKELHWSCWYLC